MYSVNGNDSIRSGTVPLPPSSPSSRRLQSTSSRSLSSTHGRRISLPSTTQDPMLFDSLPINQGKKNSDDAAFDSKGVSSSFSTRNPEPVEEAQRLQSIGGSTRRTRTRSEQSSWMKGVREPNSAVEQELSGRDWAQDSTLNGRDPDPQYRDSTVSYTVSTASSRSSYSARPSHPFFHPSHSRDVSSSTSLPSSQLHFPLPSTSSNPINSLPTTIKIRPRSSSLSLSRVRTPSNGSTASSASSDFPVTPALPASSSQRKSSIVDNQNGKGKERESDGNWSNGLPVLGGAHLGKGPAMVDPRFTFPRSRQGGNIPTTRASVQIPQNVGPFGEVRRSSEEKARSNDNSFIASLGSKPFLDSTGRELPIFSTSPPIQTSYLPTSPLQPAFAAPPSPFSPTSPVASITEASQKPLISSFFASSSPTKASRNSPAATPKRRSTSFTRRVRRRSSPRKLPSHRRTSSSSSPHRRQTSRSSSLRNAQSSSAGIRALRHRSHSVPNLRSHARSQSVPTPIPFDTFSPRSPYVHEPGAPRRPSIADELLFGDSLKRSRTVDSNLAGSEPIVFPSRKFSTGEKGKGKEHERSTSVPLAPRNRQASPTIPSRSLQPIPATIRSQSRRTPSSIPTVKGSLMLPHPKLVVSNLGGHDSDEEGSVEAIQRRYREGGSMNSNELETLESIERKRTLDEDQESIDHSSVLRVLRENEESRKEREAWSDSATKTLGLGLGLKLAEFERKRSTRGPGNIAFGGGGSGTAKEERKKARKQVEKEKRRAAESGTDGEGGGSNSPRRHRRTAEASPPMPHSFEPFTQLTRKLSLSRSKSREGATKENKVDERGTIISIPSPEAPSTPRTVRGKPIRHLRTSPSVDSIYSRTGPPLPPHAYQLDPSTQYGQALSFDDNVPINEEHRRPSLTTQNAFLSLPPHLHHLLRSPERESYEPSRAPPPVPPSQYSLSQDSNRFSTSSVASAARLSLALESHLSQLPPQPGIPAPTLARSTNARTPEITDSRLNRSVSTPALLCESSPRSSPEELAPAGRPALQSHSLSPLPELESPDSQRSANTHSDASSGLNIDNRNEFRGLFFSPPTRPGGSIQSRTEPTVSIQVASDDETSTEGTDDTFSIHRLERTRKSLEALFAPSGPINPEHAQETLLLPTTTSAPSFSRSNSHMSSAQDSFVTAQESASDGITTPNLGSSRPLPTPAQTPWASTSFAREYLDGLDGSNRNSDPTSLASKRASSRASQGSFIDFDVDGEEELIEKGPEEGVEPSQSPLSFLDDFSPPSSAPPSPAIDSFPVSLGQTAPGYASSDALEPGSLPTSPTLSSTFTEDDSNRFSRLPANRESYLSVDSQNLHISPTAAKFVNGGAGGGSTPRSHSYNSSRSNVLNSFPVPPVAEVEEAGSDGDDEEEEEEDRSNPTKIEESEESTLVFNPPSPRSPRHEPSTSLPSSSSPTYSGSPASASHSPVRPETSQSFLDVSDPSDNESKRWSRGTFQTFYSGAKTKERVPPLPLSRY